MRRVARLTLMTSVLAAPLLAQTVRVRWEPTIDFSKYETYHWLEGTHVPDDRNHQIIVDEVDAQMSINGIFTDELEPDLHVVYHASAESSFGIEGGYQTDWNTSDPIKIETHSAGTLVLDLVDAASNRLVWRGTATGSVSRDSRKNRTTVQEAMRKMFADFPPPTRRSP